MEEIWKDIKGFEGLYQVSNLGRVKSVAHYSCQKRLIKERILKYSNNLQGYYIVGLHKFGNAKTRPVHRLVAETFLPNPDNLPCINHKDENKQNNQVENLEWCTYEYNNNYGMHNEKMRKSLTGRKLSNETKQKIGKSSLGRVHSNETKEKISKSNKGKHSISIEHQQKMQKARVNLKKNIKNKIITEVVLPENIKDINDCTEEQINNLKEVW